MKCLGSSRLKGLLAIVAIVISSVAYAQPPGGGGGQRGGGQRGGEQREAPSVPSDKKIVKMVSSLSKDLSLSEEQEAQVLVVYKLHFEAVEEKLSGSSRPDRDEMMALDTKLAEDVRALLTDEQKVLYNVYLEENKRDEPEERPSN